MTSSADNFHFETYLSPFTTRYGSPPMRSVWSEIHKRKLWRKVWVSLAKAQQTQGLLTKKELADLLAHEDTIDITTAKEFEKTIYHELMSEIKTFANQAKIGGGKIHLGATSTDVLDNVTIIQTYEAFALIRSQLVNLLTHFAKRIEETTNLVCMGYTHLQPAEPTTLGYRLALYAQDFLTDLTLLDTLLPFIKGKGIKGAVGTSASYVKLLEGKKTTAFQLEETVMRDLAIPFVEISGQTYPRKIDFITVTLLASIASSLSKFAFDFRILAAPNFGEWSEKSDKQRVGSSAMPFKKNPDKMEKVSSLARFVASLQSVAWSNPANSLLERTLDDSANQRIFLPEGFLAIDECLKEVTTLVETFVVNTAVVTRNLLSYGDFSATESLLMQLVAKGASRQNMHEKIKELSFLAWDEVQKGKENPLQTYLQRDMTILRYVTPQEIAKHFHPENHIGIAKERTKRFLKTLSVLKKR